jgi:dTDP-4-dehydrorhamnose 3,5-epimerase
MVFENLELEEVKLLHHNNIIDNRGSFMKIFNFDIFEKNNIANNYKEHFFSFSKKNVLRGMHFQNPPEDYHKLVTVVNGEIKDVVMDLRTTSKTYGKCISVILSSSNNTSIYIPPGFAHGFLSLKSNTILSYLQSSCYNKGLDAGIRYDTINFDWGISNPIVSDRDLTFESFQNFKSLF